MPKDTTYLSAREVADRLGFHRETLYRQLKRGEIPGARKIGGRWRIPEWALDDVGTPAHLATA